MIHITDPADCCGCTACASICAQIRLLSRKFIKFSASLSCIQIGSMIAIILTVIMLKY